jgi:hypothetical protein
MTSAFAAMVRSMAHGMCTLCMSLMMHSLLQYIIESSRPGWLSCFRDSAARCFAGYDKVMHVWQLHAQGFQLVGHPGAWVVHRPHTPSAGYLKAFTGPRYTAQHQVHSMHIVVGMASGHPAVCK